MLHMSQYRVGTFFINWFDMQMNSDAKFGWYLMTTKLLLMHRKINSLKIEYFVKSIDG